MKNKFIIWTLKHKFNTKLNTFDYKKTSSSTPIIRRHQNIIQLFTNKINKTIYELLFLKSRYYIKIK